MPTQTCPSCNTILNASANFCPSCGREVGAKPVCPNCGSPLRAGARFCAGCGQTIAPPAPTATPTAPPYSPPQPRPLVSPERAESGEFSIDDWAKVSDLTLSLARREIDSYPEEHRTRILELSEKRRSQIKVKAPSAFAASGTTQPTTTAEAQPSLAQEASGSIKATGSNTAKAPATPVEAMLARVALVLEDGDWQKADELLEQVLNQDPHNAQAYFGKVLAQLKLPSANVLVAKATEIGIKSLKECKDYEKALRFADPNFRFQLQCYDPANWDDLCQQATALLDAPRSFERCQKAALLLEYIAPGYKKISSLLAERINSAKQAHQKYKQIMQELNESKSPVRFQDALRMLRSIQPSYAEIDAAIEKCKTMAESQAQAEKRAIASAELQRQIQEVNGTKVIIWAYRGERHYRLQFYGNGVVLKPGGANILNFSTADLIRGVFGGGEIPIAYADIQSVKFTTTIFGTKKIIVSMKNDRIHDIRIRFNAAIAEKVYHIILSQSEAVRAKTNAIAINATKSPPETITDNTSDKSSGCLKVAAIPLAIIIFIILVSSC